MAEKSAAASRWVGLDRPRARVLICLLAALQRPVDIAVVCLVVQHHDLLLIRAEVAQDAAHHGLRRLLERVVLAVALQQEARVLRDTPDLLGVLQLKGVVVRDRDARMLEYMELLAVFECSRRSMLPAKYRDLPSVQLRDALAQIKRELLL